MNSRRGEQITMKDKRGQRQEESRIWRYDQKAEKRNSSLLAAVLAAVVIIVAAVCFLFTERLKSIIHKETDRYLGEISEHVASMVNDRVSNNLKMLDSIGSTYEELEDHEDGLAWEYLGQTAERYGFIHLAVIDMDGNFRSTDGYNVNVAEEEGVQAALAGNEIVTGVFSSPVDGTKGIMYAVPLYENGGIVGALTVWNTEDQMRDALSIESFGGEGYSHIVTSDGTRIVSSGNHNSTGGFTNYFDEIEESGTLKKGYSLEKLKEDIAQGKTGILQYTLEDGIEKIMSYRPLEPEGWYLLSIVPTSASTKKYGSVIGETAIINTAIVLLFFGVMIGVIRMDKGNKKRLRELAFVDPVTGGRSRVRFEIELEETLKEAKSGEYKLVSMDIRKFKLLNDLFGSREGNSLLKYVYGMIMRNLGPGEMAARVTADRFKILLKCGDNEEAVKRLERLAEEINEFNRNLVRKYIIQIVCGIYTVDEPDLDVITIQDRANTARKENKETVSGKLCECMFYSEIQRQRLLREKELENRMETALKQEEFVIYLQPKVKLEDNKVVGAEALVRWEDPEKGLVPPGDFIPFFEKNGFIKKLDLYVFETVCLMIRDWMRQGIEPVPVSINFSRCHLDDPDCLRKYKRLQEEYGIPARLLEIELTETMIFENLEELIGLIDQIHELGFVCSLDDFGSGYSSLNLLSEVKVDTMKLDKAFFRDDLKDDERSQSVIAAVVDLAKKLNMKSVSEGVETMDQVEFLKKIQCDMVQGFVFSKPVPRKIFEEMAFRKEEKGNS